MYEREIKKIIIVSKLSLQISLLKDLLDRTLDIPIQVTTFDELYKMTNSNFNDSLFIFDDECLKEEDAYRYIKILFDNKITSSQVLINSDKNSELSKYMIWPNLMGVFYDSDDFDVLTQGLNRVLTGEFWFTRALSQKLIMAYRKNECPNIKVCVDLTEREKQIMQLLAIGASNAQIADSLFVSENTVKTHLHNIFKKINVKNRLQALMWLRHSDSNLSKSSVSEIKI